jgi:transcription elongation factor Elf1
MKIKIRTTPTEYKLKWHEFVCQHTQATSGTFEQSYQGFGGIDYTELKTLTCDECGAEYNFAEEEWE